jgi:hypothetical protein
MSVQKRLSISEQSLKLLLEQVDLNPPTTAMFIKSVVSNDIKQIEDDKQTKEDTAPEED